MPISFRPERSTVSLPVLAPMSSYAQRRPDFDTLSNLVTVCIAAVCKRLGAIVTINDTMLASDTDAQDGVTPKRAAIGQWEYGPWVCLYTGDPKIFDFLTSYMNVRLGNAPHGRHTRHEIEAIVAEAYDSLINHEVNRATRQKFGMTITEAASTLRQEPDRYDAISTFGNEILPKIRAGLSDDPTELLVCGFDDHKNAHIFSTDAVGNCTPRDEYGYHAVGVGAQTALGWLSAHQGFNWSESVSNVAYRLFEAKFASEVSRSVGPTTVLFAFCDDGTPPNELVYSGQLAPKEIRAAWNEHRRRPISPEAIEIIDIGLRDVVARSAARIKEALGPSGQNGQK